MAEPAEQYPVVERIAQAVKTAVEGVTEAKGFRVTITGVVRPAKFGVTAAPGHLGALLMQGEPSPAGEVYSGGDGLLAEWEQPFDIGVVLRVSDQATTSFDQIANIAAAEVQRAVLADPGWGGLAIDSRVEPPQVMQADDRSFEGISVQLAVRYRTPANDPYRVA